MEITKSVLMEAAEAWSRHRSRDRDVWVAQKVFGWTDVKPDGDDMVGVPLRQSERIVPHFSSWGDSDLVVLREVREQWSDAYVEAFADVLGMLYQARREEDVKYACLDPDSPIRVREWLRREPLADHVCYHHAGDYSFAAYVTLQWVNAGEASAETDEAEV